MADQTELALLLSKIVLDLSDLKKDLAQGRSEMQSFKTMAQGVGESVKKAFAFAGVAVGIYEIASALKEFFKDAAITGARTETLAVGLELIGKNAGISKGTLDYYVERLKVLGITTQEAMNAVTRFVVSGLPLDKIEQLADVARNQAALVGKNTSEAFNDILTGIVTQQPEVLRKYLLNIGLLSTVLGSSAESLDPLTRSIKVLNATLDVGQRSAGAYEAAMGTVGKQSGSIARFAEEARNSLWALFGPIMMEVVQQTTKAWKELKAWADANRDSLKAWGVGIAEFIQRKIELITQIGKAINKSRELVLAVGEMLIFKTAASWLVAMGTASIGAYAGLIKLATGIETVKIAMGGWLGILIKLIGVLAAYSVYQTIKKPTDLGAMSPEEKQLLGEAWVLKGPTAAKPEPIPGSEGFGSEGIESPSEIEAKGKKAKEEADAAHQKALADAQKYASGGGKDKKSAKETSNNLLAPYLSMLKAKRDADLQDAQNSLDLLKATDDTKRAELERSLAAQEIDGATYYQRLQELQQQETTAALALIEQKRAAQQKAYRDSLAELEADTKLSPEAKAIASQKLAAENRKALSVLDAEAAKTKLDGEKKVTDELKRQAEIRVQYQQKTEDLNAETAQLLGAVSEQEATLQKLYLDWQRAKQDAIDKGGYTPEYAAALDANYQAKKIDAQYGGLASSISSGLSSLVDTLVSGGSTLKEAANDLFKSLFDEALKPGIEALKKALISGFNYLFGEAGGALASAVMGAVALVGMLLTKDTSSSWSSSGVTSSVTSSEAVRGVIAGDTSIAIADISTSLEDAFVDTNAYLAEIAENTRNIGGTQINLSISGLEDSLKQALSNLIEDYLANQLQLGAPA